VGPLAVSTNLVDSAETGLSATIQRIKDLAIAPS